ncbi:MAG: GNAT family N-acetyltransferase [Saprospiraceae bacterium]
MEIRNLQDTKLELIVACLLKAFANYFVKMPASVPYWRQRFKLGRVDFAHSYGVFEEGELVAFIINGIDEYEGLKTAFNTGTGVVPAFRGRALVDQIYDFALPALRAIGVKRCGLEVIQKNDRAIRVYERIGFRAISALRSFKMEAFPLDFEFSLKKEDYHTLSKTYGEASTFYAWDHQATAVQLAGDTFESYSVWKSSNELVGHFTINPTKGDLIQFEARPNHLSNLFAGIQHLIKKVRIINVDDRNLERITFLQENAAFTPLIEQNEMEFLI